MKTMEVQENGESLELTNLGDLQRELEQKKENPYAKAKKVRYMACPTDPAERELCEGCT